MNSSSRGTPHLLLAFPVSYTHLDVYKRQAPRTILTGYGRDNMEWGKRTIDGIPGLMIEGEYEWWLERCF